MQPEAIWSLEANHNTPLVHVAWVRNKTEHEQFPQHLGWKRPAVSFEEGDLERFMDEIEKYTKELEGNSTSGSQNYRRRLPRRGTHFGF